PVAGAETHSPPTCETHGFYESNGLSCHYRLAVSKQSVFRAHIYVTYWCCGKTGITFSTRQPQPPDRPTGYTGQSQKTNQTTSATRLTSKNVGDNRQNFDDDGGHSTDSKQFQMVNRNTTHRLTGPSVHRNIVHHGPPVRLVIIRIQPDRQIHGHP